VRTAVPTSPSATVAASGVTLTLDTQPISGVINKGDRYVATMSGHWQATSAGTIYLQASDSAGGFVAPAPTLVSTKQSIYTVGLGWPASMPPGVYTGTLSIRACEDSQCAQPYAGTLHSVDYTMTVNKVGEWETLQRTSRHDGYVPITVDAARYHPAWTFESAGYLLSGVVTDSDTVYFSEPGSSTPVSVYAKRATDGVTKWRRVFTSIYGFGPDLAPPSVSDGVVYVATTAQEDTWVHALRASDGMQTYQSQFFTQWGSILNPTVHNGKVYVNAGGYTGVVYAFNIADGSASWNASGGTYGMNTPAVDDDFVYSYNGETLDVFNATDGSVATSIGPSPGGVYDDYNASPMLGSADHVLTYGGNARYHQNRQLLDYSIANHAVRWMSIALYTSYPAVAKGVVYAASDETGTFDALDEATGRVLWSWKPSEPTINFVGNVVVTDNVALVSTFNRIYAVDLRRHRAVWSAPTPGTISLSANRMLFVSSPLDSSTYPTKGPRITAYRLD
jgi:outer membrane protein assembly factor BamB